MPRGGARRAMEPNEVTPADRFHFHVDACGQCRTNPRDLCRTGAALFTRSGIDPVDLQAFLEAQRVASRRGHDGP
jgi:hypothetical protein